MFALPHQLSAKGIIGLNQRNAGIILPFNDRSKYPLVDDKAQTKKIAQAAGLAVPPLYGDIGYAGQVKEFSKMIADHKEFVIKPAQGAGGDGIVVIKDRFGGYFQKSNGSLVDEDALLFHIQNSLGGVFSLGGQPDRVLIEYCVQFDPIFEKISYQGVPDVRVIVFFGVPVMAMVRLPTRMSDGRANLHQGAIGTGVDLTSGTTLTAVWLNKVIDRHPDTREPVSGVSIPHWDEIMDISARTYELTGLGYQGVDVVLDRDMGPLILELNARPGLNIQIANKAGLQPRIDLVMANKDNFKDPAERVAFARENFGAAHVPSPGGDS